MKKRILLLSGYDAASHRYWRNILAEKLTEFEWTQLAMPDRHFYWRVRGNSLGFAFQHRQTLEQEYDLLIATSMVDLSSLRGFCPSLSNIPTIVYFHENQFAYPVSDQKPNLINVQLTSIYNALCADKILFNSQYNQTTFLSGAKALLSRLPDLVPKGLLALVQQRAEILPVPVNVEPPVQRSRQRNNPPHIVWNHRWEYDKQPEVFFNALLKLKQTGFGFRLHILGQSFRKQPQCFSDARDLFADEIETFGFQTRERYLEIMCMADFVVSSSLHDFQGLSLQEGIVLGCIPIAPNRVAYPEYIPDSLLYEVSEQQTDEAESLYHKLLDVLPGNIDTYPDLSHYSLTDLIPLYRLLIEQSM